MVTPKRIQPRVVTNSVVGSARDIDVLESIAWARFLTTDQVQRLHFPSRRTAQRRLRALLDHGLVRAALQGEDALHKTNLYTVTAQGADRLVEAGVGDEGSMRPGRVPRLQKLKHALVVRDVFVEFRLAEQRGVFDLVDFRFEEDLAGEPLFRAARLIPDGLARVRHGGTDETLGVEVDLGTETTTTLRSKIVAWRSVLPHLGWSSVVFVVPGQTRAATCTRLATEAGVSLAVVHADALCGHLGARTRPLFAPAVRDARIASDAQVGGTAQVTGSGSTAFRAIR